MLWFLLLVGSLYLAYRVYNNSKPMDENTTPTTPPSEPDEQPTIMRRAIVPPTNTYSPRDQTSGVFESLNWCNDITRICWPHICKIVESQLRPTLEPLVNLYLPKPFSKFRIISAKLGTDPLEVARVTVHRRHRDSIAMDLDVHFQGSPNIVLKCNPLSAHFGIKQLTWKGRLSILLRPLLPQLPLIGAVQAAMVTHPEIELKFSGIASTIDFGPIERIIRMVLRNVLASMIVLPNRFIYKLSDSVDYFSVYQPPLGVMAVTIERGRNFTKEKKVGMIKAIPDLYCKASFGLESMKTDVQMNNLNPEWGKSHSFIVSDLEQPFKLDCYDKDTITKDDLVGTVIPTAEELLSNESKWYKLKFSIDDKIAKDGEIFITAQLFVFRDPLEPVRGRCVLSILIDRAKNLPANTKSAFVKVSVGNTEKNKINGETPQITKPDDPIPGIDPVNPIWNFSFDFLLNDFSTADTTLEVFDGKELLGKVFIDATKLEASDSNVQEGEFPLGIVNASLRAKVVLRGLIPDKIPQRGPQPTMFHT